LAQRIVHGEVPESFKNRSSSRANPPLDKQKVPNSLIAAVNRRLLRLTCLDVLSIDCGDLADAGADDDQPMVMVSRDTMMGNWMWPYPPYKIWMSIKFRLRE
ncbi:hypothetical protein Tco_1486223, partial [Tanacetum coccineum]